MKKAKLPLPLLILILATLFSLASTFGEWIGRPSSALHAPPSDKVEQQQAAIVYVRVMSWLSRLVTHPVPHSEGNSESGRPAELLQAPTRSVPAHRLRLCALNTPSRPWTTPHRSSRGSRADRHVCMRLAAGAVHFSHKVDPS